VIVRLMGEGQYRVSDELREQLNELDDRAAAALEANDEIELDNRLDEMWELVRHEGEKLADDDLSTSDAVIPPSDLTLEESRQLMSHEGFIPDVPVSGQVRASRAG
jgi:chromosome condensin MukBEF complex kleisin-like MukF subunit